MRLPRGARRRIVLAFAVLAILVMAGAGALLISAVNAEAGDSRDLVSALLVIVFGAGAAIVTLLLLMAFFLTRLTDRSVRSVARSARRISEGELEHRATVAPAGVTRDLAIEVNRMATSLRVMIHDLAGERDKLSAVLDTMVDGVVVVAPNGRIEIINHAASDLLSLREEDAGIRDIGELMRDPDLRGMISLCQSTGVRQSAEVELNQAGHLIPVTIIATPLSGEAPPEVLLTIHDLSMVRQIESTRREFVSNVSHELRSPLASIRVMTETLEDGALEDEAQARDFLGRIRREVDRMVVLVEDLLDLARLESGREQGPQRLLQLGPVMQDTVVRFGERAAERGVTLEMSLPEGLRQVRADGERIGQVLGNLVENALKWTQSGGSVKLWAEDAPGVVRVSVQDTGVGIAPEHMPHIFERFYKVDRARRDGGSGLGLSIVKHIVQLYGGEVTAASRPGQGSTFSFTLPSA